MVAPPPHPSETNNTVPTGLDRVIETGLAKQTTDRYPTAVEMAAAARQAITSPVTHVPPAAPTRPAQNWAPPPGPVLTYPPTVPPAPPPPMWSPPPPSPPPPPTRSSRTPLIVAGALAGVDVP